MAEIKIKRVYEDFQETDGFRILVDKLWPRGIKKEWLKYDYWAKEMTPSAALRKWFHEDMKEHWEGFAEQYRQELDNSAATPAFLSLIRSHPVVTLLYASKEPMHNHARILCEYLRRHQEE